jgi:hypothetical protein
MPSSKAFDARTLPAFDAAMAKKCAAGVALGRRAAV